MKLVTFSQNGLTKVGAISDEAIVDLSELVNDEPWNLIRIIDNAESLRLARELLNNPKQTIKLDEVVLEAPILRPRKFLGLGMNYKKHVEELKDRLPDVCTSRTSSRSIYDGPLIIVGDSIRSSLLP